MTAPCERGDSELVAGLRAGDLSCLAGIYDRYADRLYDFCVGMLRDCDDAADAVQDTFVLASRRFGQLRDPQRLRPWLYAIARSVALRRARSRRRVRPTDAVIDAPDPAAGPERLAEQAALRRLVADATDGLGDADRAMLRLHLHGLDAAEVAAALGISAAAAHVRLSRLRDQLERCIRALLVARAGRRDCPELAAVLAGWDGRLTPLMRKRVGRHADRCARCAQRGDAVAGPRALLPGVVVLPAPVALRERVLGDTRLVAHAAPPRGPSGPAGPSVPAGAAGAAGSRPGRARAGARRGPHPAAAALVALALAAAIATMWGERPGAVTQLAVVPVGQAPVGPTVAAPAPPGVGPARGGAPDAQAPDGLAGDGPPAGSGPAGAPPPPGAGTDPAPPDPAPPDPAPPGPAPPGPAPPGPAAADPAAADPAAADLGRPIADPPSDRLPPPAPAPPRITGQDASPARLGMRGCPASRATVRVSLAEDAPASAAVLSWTGRGGTGSQPLRGSGTTWSGTLGPFGEPGTVTWWVTASNGSGSTTGARQAIPVTPCDAPAPTG